MDSNPNSPERKQNQTPEDESTQHRSTQSGEAPAYDEYDVAPAENVTNPNLNDNAEEIPAVTLGSGGGEQSASQTSSQTSSTSTRTQTESSGSVSTYSSTPTTDGVQIYPSGGSGSGGGDDENVAQRFYRQRVQPLVDRGVQRVKNNPRTSTIIAVTLFAILLGFIVPVPEPHVALSGEPILPSGPKWVTNSLVGMVIIDIVLIAIALLATRKMSLIPSGFQNFMEMILEYFYNLGESIAGSRVRQFFPVVMTIFLYVVLSNWSGLIPGVGSIGVIKYEETVDSVEIDFEDEESPGDDPSEGRSFDFHIASADLSVLAAPAQQDDPLDEDLGEEIGADEPGGDAHGGEYGKFIPLYRAPSADLNMTFALALITMIMVQYYGFKTLGGSYLSKFFTLKGEGFMKGINGFVGILELVSQFSRLLAFGFRLFGNVFAGEILLATITFLVAFMIPLPFYFLEVFVGLVQAFVFAMLALVFFTEATISHADHH